MDEKEKTGTQIPKINNHGKHKFDFFCRYEDKMVMVVKGKLYEEAVQKLGLGLLKYEGRMDINGHRLAADAINNYVKEKLGNELLNNYGFDCNREAYHGLKAKFYEEAIKKLKSGSEEFIEILNPKDIANSIETYVKTQMIKYYEGK